ncbi:MAG TPA: hypothetical protein VK629_05650 [Steroidobacteraceae bacterium]|nr:hypothetical protein [Steroidobacteraceae bacterium]
MIMVNRPVKLVPAKDIKPGDMLDLEGDQFADPKKDKPFFECELGTVESVERETPDCVAIMIEGVDMFGFPPEHLLCVHGHIDGYDE